MDFLNEWTQSGEQSETQTTHDIMQQKQREGHSSALLGHFEEIDFLDFSTNVMQIIPKVPENSSLS